MIKLSKKINLDVDKIAKEYKGGLTTVELSKKYCVNPSTIQDRLRPLGILRKAGSRRKNKVKIYKRYVPRFSSLISIYDLCINRINCKSISGIYLIFCAANNKIYIGSSINIKSRIKRHMMFLRQGKHFNSHLQNAYDKYGEYSFFLNILENCNESDLYIREEFWIKFLNSCDKNIGFNKKNSGCGGKTSSGSNNYLSKLSSSDVREIRKQFDSNIKSICELANEYCLSYQTMWRVVNRKSYKDE